MAKFQLSVCPAYSSMDGKGITMMLSMLMKDQHDILPRREVEARTTADALKAFDDYVKDAEATGRSLACFIRLARGERSPNGFKKAEHTRYANLRTEQEERARVGLNPDNTLRSPEVTFV